MIEEFETNVGGFGSAGERNVSSFNSSTASLSKNPQEVAFFRALYYELNKATQFFGMVEEEFRIRESRVQNGIKMLSNPVRSEGICLWLMAIKSVCRLYKDLLALETFAIMTLCSVSRILKEHDRATGLETRSAFMKKVVSQANFANYSRTMEMLQRIEVLFEDAMRSVVAREKMTLLDDELLLVNVFTKLNKQATDLLEAETEPFSPPKKSKRRKLDGSPNMRESSCSILCPENLENIWREDAQQLKWSSRENK